MNIHRTFYVIAFFMTLLISSDGMATVNDTKLTGYFIASFLNEANFAGTMKLYEDQRNIPKSSGNFVGAFGCLLHGHRAWSGLGNGSFNEFQETRFLFRTVNNATNFFTNLVNNNSRAKRPDSVTKGKIGDICYVWVYPVGPKSLPESYFVKYYFREKNLITLIRVDVKPLNKGGSATYSPLKQIQPYVRLAIVKNAYILNYVKQDSQQGTNTSKSRRGINIRHFPKS